MQAFVQQFENDGQFWAESHNGFTDKISGIQFLQGESHSGAEYVDIDVLNSRGHELRGGSRIPLSAMLDLCADLLRANGYNVRREDEGRSVPEKGEPFAQIDDVQHWVSVVLVPYGFNVDLWHEERGMIDYTTITWDQITKAGRAASDGTPV